MARPGSDHHLKEAFNERNRKELGPQDLRYLQKGSTLYAFSMGWDGKPVIFPELAPGGRYQAGKIQDVTLLGFKGKLNWKQESGGLKVDLPADKPSDYAVAFRVQGV